MNSVVHPPLAYLLQRPAEILQEWSIEHLERAIRRKAGKKARHIVKKRSHIAFSRSQGFLSSLAIVDVCDKGIPVENLSFRISHGDHAGLKPAVCAIETTQAILKVKWLTSRERVAENFDRVS